MFRVFTECSECSSRRAYGGGCRPHTPAVPLRGASLPPSVIGVMRGVGGNAREFLGEHCSKCSPSVQSVHGLPTTTSSTGVRATIHLEICDVGSNCCCGAPPPPPPNQPHQPHPTPVQCIHLACYVYCRKINPPSSLTSSAPVCCRSGCPNIAHRSPESHTG